MTLLDTNILLHYIRADALAQYIETLYSLRSTSDTIISVVSEGEIRALALQFGWGTAKVQAMEVLLSRFTVVSLPYKNIVNVYTQIDDYSKRRGVTMGKNDVWIAATAHVTGARLLTTDRDFDHLDPAFLGRDWVDSAAA